MIIAVTGHCEDAFIEKAYKCGMNGVSPKPIDHELLRDILFKL